MKNIEIDDLKERVCFGQLALSYEIVFRARYVVTFPLCCEGKALPLLAFLLPTLVSLLLLGIIYQARE